ncbi:transmembrane protein 6/97 [Flagelloscypha sp. PMI_526]|nr:transmembrane protein 6/97 [Flagelloscypha sp. PMI_526]
MARPLTTRPFDLVYFIFFVFHFPASLLVDFQTIAPQNLIPSPLKQLPLLYINQSNDPLIGGLLGYFGDTGSSLVWFKSMIYVEMLVQVPIFVLGAWGLWRDSKAVYPILLAYAGSTATSTLPCVTTIIDLPLVESIPAIGTYAVTFNQKVLLLSGYVPFFLLPLIMVIDMTIRVSKLVAVAEKAQALKKNK